MGIEVGEYVRTRAGYFYKITRIDENGLIYWNKIQCGWSMEQLKDIVLKHSKNIIDLIEVGDYVNGKLVSNVDKVDNTNFIEWDNGDMYSTENQNDKFIKSIVTKEFFLNAEYRVEAD